MQETPVKSTISSHSRFTTPVSNRSPHQNEHAFATPEFLRPTAQPLQSPQSPSLHWQRIPRQVKGLSALISDFRSNQQMLFNELECEAWQDEDELEIASLGDSPGVAGHKTWSKRGARRSTRRVIST